METTRRTIEEKIRIVEELQRWRVQGGTTVRFAEENGITRKSLNEWKRKLPASGADWKVTLVGEPDLTDRPETAEGAPVLISVGGVTVTVFGGSPIACVSRVLALLGVSHVL
jgi:transposase-like protein